MQSGACYLEHLSEQAPVFALTGVELERTIQRSQSSVLNFEQNFEEVEVDGDGENEAG